MPSCCVASCSNDGEFYVTTAQMEVAKSAHARPTKGVKAKDLSYTADSKKLVCASHAFDVMMPHVQDAMKAATSKQNLTRREFIHDLLMAIGTHESQPEEEEEPLPKKRARVAEPPSTPNPFAEIDARHERYKRWLVSPESMGCLSKDSRFKYDPDSSLDIDEQLEQAREAYRAKYPHLSFDRWAR